MEMVVHQRVSDKRKIESPYLSAGVGSANGRKCLQSPAKHVEVVLVAENRSTVVAAVINVVFGVRAEVLDEMKSRHLLHISSQNTSCYSLGLGKTGKKYGGTCGGSRGGSRGGGTCSGSRGGGASAAGRRARQGSVRGGEATAAGRRTRQGSVRRVGVRDAPASVTGKHPRCSRVRDGEASATLRRPRQGSHPRRGATAALREPPRRRYQENHANCGKLSDDGCAPFSRRAKAAQ